MSEELPVEKRCSKCGEVKPVDLFTRQRRQKDGLNSECKTCSRERCNIYSAAHTEEKRAYDAAYRQANIEKKLEYERIYRITHKEEIQAYKQAKVEEGRRYSRLYYAANAEAICEHKRDQRAIDPEVEREYKRRHRAANPDMYVIYFQRRRNNKKANGGTFTIQEFKSMRVAQAGVCAYCRYQYNPAALTIDHIIPISRGGRHEALNICLACPRCNYSKHNKLLSEWLNRWYERKNRPRKK